MRFLRPISIAISLAILSSLALPLSSGGALAQSEDWEFLTLGIDYKEFHLSDPNNVFVSRMERDNPNVTIEGLLADGVIWDENPVDSRETVRSMFIQAEGTLGFWGKQWGMRMDAVVGINGFFTVSESDPTLRSGQVQSGWYAKRFMELQSMSGFVWNQNRSAFFGQCIYHIADKQRVTFLDQASVYQKFHDINVPRGDNQMILYTTQYGASTRTDNEGLEVVVEMQRPTSPLPAGAGAQGIIRQIRPNSGNSPIPFDHIVLSAVGDSVESLEGKAKVGERVAISQEINYCIIPVPPEERYDWTNAYTAIGVDKYILKKGNINVGQDIAQRQPMTAIAFNEDYVYFIVVDGRESGVSRGMSNYEIAQFAKTYLSATEAATLDGGGSSTMVVNDEVVNNTTCNFINCDDDTRAIPIDDTTGLLMEATDLGDANGSPTMGVWSIETEIYEAIVPNGLLMVVAEPPVLFNAFPVGSTPQVFTDTGLRLGPGDNYDRIDTIPEWSSVTVVENINNMNGISVQGAYWWKVSYNEQVGWAALDVTQVDFPNHVYLPIIR